MSNNESLEKALDLIIEDAVNIVNEREGYESPAPEVVFSKAHEIKMQHLFKKIHQQDIRFRFVNFSKLAACVCIVAAITASLSIYSVEAWRTKFLKLIYDENAPNSDYSFSDSASAGYTDGNITLSYFPQGFELTKKAVTSKEFVLYFTKDNLFLSVKISDFNMQFNTDTEDSTIEQLSINGYDATGIYKNDLNQIIWNDGNYVYHVSSNLPQEEIKRISKNLKKN